MTCMRSLLLLGSFSSFAHLRGWSPINSQKAVFIVVKIDSIFLKVRLFISISLWNTLFYWNIIWTSGLISFLTLWLIIYCYCQSSHNYARHRMKFPEVLNIFKSLWQFRQMYYGGKCKNKSESKLPVNMEPSKKKKSTCLHVYVSFCPQRVALVLEFGCILSCRRAPCFYFESPHRKSNRFTLTLLTQFHFLNWHFTMKWQNKSRRRYLLVRFQTDLFCSILCCFFFLRVWNDTRGWDKRANRFFDRSAHWFWSQSLEPAGCSRQPFGSCSVCVRVCVSTVSAWDITFNLFLEKAF